MLYIEGWNGWHYLFKAACLMRPRLLCVFRRVKDYHDLLHYSQLLKNICVRQVVLDKCFPLRNHSLQAILSFIGSLNYANVEMQIYNISLSLSLSLCLPLHIYIYIYILTYLYIYIYIYIIISLLLLWYCHYCQYYYMLYKYTIIYIYIYVYVSLSIKT